MEDDKSIRSFLAIDLPAEVLNKIRTIQNQLKKTIEGSIGWTRPEGIHLTLKFFGNISENDISNITMVIENHVNRIKPLALNAGNLGVFPTLARPRVLWLGVGGDVEPLAGFQKSIDSALQDFGFEGENRPFRPHLTLARIKDPKSVIGLAKIMEKSDNYEAGHFHAGGITLFKSQLSPKGAIYTKLAYFPFAC